MIKAKRWMWAWALTTASIYGCGGKDATTATDAGIVLPDGAVADEGDSSDSDSSDGTSTTGDSGSTGSAAGSEGAGTSSDGTTGETDSGDVDDPTMITDTIGVADVGWVVPDELKLCGDRACACANGIDDDGDGVADGFDSECTGPNDDDEDSFATGISGDNQDPKWQDCFFDGNSGAGDDDCKYHTDCLTGVKPADDPDCQVSAACIEFCTARTPNGCDCFGCCDFESMDGSTISVVISEDCKEEDLGACTQCVKAEDSCNNPCGECELCPGRSLSDLPDTCFSTPTTPTTPTTDAGVDPDGNGGTGGTAGGGSEEPTPTCDNGEPTCLSMADCGSAAYCAFGCCVPVTLQ